MSALTSGDDAATRIARSGLPVPDDSVLRRLRQYLDLRSAWSDAHNLAGPGAASDPWGSDLVDGLALCAVLQPGLTLVDIGAGAGSLSVVARLLRPELPVICVEPLVKRAAFLRTVHVELGLGAVTVERRRWPVRLDTDVQVVARAVARVGDWPEFAVSGGEHVVAFHRLLAAQRPDVAVGGFALRASFDYLGAQGGSRRAECWVRS